MQPTVQKRRTPKVKVSQSDLLSDPKELQEEAIYYLECESKYIPVNLLVYGHPKYRHSINPHFIDDLLEELALNKGSIPLDKYYLSYAIQDKRLFRSEKESKPSVSAGVDVFKEINKAYYAAPKAVFYRYLDILKKFDIKPLKAHLEYIAKLASYAPGWIYYKTVELGIK